MTPVGGFEVLDASVDARFVDTANRPTLAQSFRDDATGRVVTVAVNHLRSKGSPCTTDPDPGDGQGKCPATRTSAARALMDWLATDPTGSGSANVLVIGDLNAYTQEDPVTAVRAGADDVLGDRRRLRRPVGTNPGGLSVLVRVRCAGRGAGPRTRQLGAGGAGQPGRGLACERRRIGRAGLRHDVQARGPGGAVRLPTPTGSAITTHW